MTRNIPAKPFLKWAGGKTQLLTEIEKCLPRDVLGRKFTYVEPFVGSGAVLFWMLNRFPNLEKAIINDINADLINTYRMIANSPRELILTLKELQLQYYALRNCELKKKHYYYDKRTLYNSRKTDEVTHAALFIFLNRTCFNGLYRVNRSNLFNVPMGSYISPTICDEQNIMTVSKILQRVEILQGDFENTLIYATPDTLFYLDPPYKAVSETAKFTSYTKMEFDDNEQIRLRDFSKKLSARGSLWILSNSDAQGDRFFDEIYSEFKIKRVMAKRLINSKPDKRGKLSEILVTNYEVGKSITSL